MNKEEIVAYLKAYAAQLGKDTLSARQVDAHGKISSSRIHDVFDGFSEALIQAGLKPRRTYKRDRKRMLRQLADLRTDLGRDPSKTEIGNNLAYNARHYETEFGGVPEALLLAQKDRLNGDERRTKQSAPAVRGSLTKSTSSRRYGSVVDFRCLRYAPTNELGVIFLFGMVAEELGFVVENIQGPFPDCDAKRKQDDGSHERVRIEFEFNSSHFEDHGHNPDECDVIICWEHDWADCPLEVIELSSVVQTLKRTGSS
ncbi:MAG: hypothetical protein V3U10_01280 [Bacteroidota bacterium]